VLKIFIQVIETLPGISILIALVFAAYGRAFRSNGGGKRFLYSSAAGTAAAFVLAVLRRTTALINLGVWSAWIMAFAFLAEAVILWLFWAKKAASGTGGPGGVGGSTGLGRIFGPAAAALAGALLFYSLPPVFLMPTDFVLAEESYVNTAFLFKCAGYAAGLIVVFVTALALFKIVREASRKSLGFFLSIMIGITALRQLAEIIRFLFARRVIPLNRRLFGIISTAVNNEIVFLFALIAAALALVFMCFARTFRKAEARGNPAERRKRKAELRNLRRWGLAAAAGCSVVLLSLTSLKAISEKAVELSPAEEMTISGDEIIIPAARIDDGHLHRFAFTAEGGTEVRFIVVKKSASAYGVGFDACDICGATGYYERKDGIVCSLCDVVMNLSTIGFRGGCNPVPLAYTMRSGAMIIKILDLENEKKRFQ
jgi:uncharacterized membrane protein